MKPPIFLYCLVFKLLTDKEPIITTKIVEGRVGKDSPMLFLNLKDATDYMHNLNKGGPPLSPKPFPNMDFSVECEDGSVKIYHAYIYKLLMYPDELIYHIGKNEYEKLNE